MSKKVTTNEVFLVLKEGPLTVQKLAVVLGTPVSTMLSLINRLEQSGRIESTRFGRTHIWSVSKRKKVTKKEEPKIEYNDNVNLLMRNW